MLKRFSFLPLIIFITFFVSCNNQKSASTGKIQVGVFDGFGGAQTCIWEAVEAVKLDKGMEVKTVTSSDISNGALKDLDVLLIPGGGGSRQYMNLGGANIERIRSFVKEGKGIVGICAGAYFLSSTPDYACMHMSGAQGTDIEHDNRGHGVAKFTLTAEGKKLFPEIAERDTCFVVYYEGPVLIKANDSINYNTLAIMQSDVHEEGNAPANTTNNKPFFITNTYGKGRVFSSIAHPEATPGMQWLIPRMVRWAANKETISYSKEIIRPDLLNKENLFTLAKLDQEGKYYKTLLYGTPAEKTDALKWLEENLSWDAKRWVQGMVYDTSAQVKQQAAWYIARTGYTKYRADVQSVYENEKNAAVKKELKAALDFLTLHSGN